MKSVPVSEAPFFVPTLIHDDIEWLTEHTDIEPRIERPTKQTLRVIHEGKRLRLELNYRRNYEGRWRLCVSPLFQDGEQREKANGWEDYARIFNRIEHGKKPELLELDPLPPEHKLPLSVRKDLAVFRDGMREHGGDVTVGLHGLRYVICYSAPNGARWYQHHVRRGAIYTSHMSQIYSSDGNDITREVIEGTAQAEFKKLAARFVGNQMPSKMSSPSRTPESFGASNSVAARKHSVIRV
ncbi:hypothetical protein GCM10010400_29280 [Streptomyces aculeolatus]|uniref:hypothetical protein n=1 Tax=Streptomyces aculeolatus TaxID=270689 RepID=UPI001CEC040D|nr:hypothetical protein [Streptomyces aculeolatus]